MTAVCMNTTWGRMTLGGRGGGPESNLKSDTKRLWLGTSDMAYQVKELVAQAW